MKSYRLITPGSIDGLAITDEAMPSPGAGEVLVRVQAVSLNYRDLLVVNGWYPLPNPGAPVIPCSDGAGEVVAVGPGVKEIAPGTLVAGIFAQKWLNGPIPPDASAYALGGGIDGMLTEYIVLPESGVVPVPAHLSAEQAACLPCAAVTAWQAVETFAGVSKRDTVVVLGTGGVSIFAAQFALTKGARVIATSSSEEKLERLRAMGVTGLVNYKTTPDWEKSVLSLTDNRGADLVVEVGGAGTLPKSMRAVRDGGKIALIGLLAAGGEIDPMKILLRHITMSGILVGSREMFLDMNDLIEAAVIQPVIDRVFAFDDAKSAFHHLASGAHYGKVVIKV